MVIPVFAMLAAAVSSAVRPSDVAGLAALAHARTVTAVSRAAHQSVPSEQQGPALYELRLKDGSVIYGVIESSTTERVRLKTIAGVVLDVDRTTIASLVPARGQVVAGEFLPSDSNTTRLFFAPTARSLRRGEAYIGVYEFLLPFVQFGLSDRLSVGVGTPLLFLEDETGRPVWLTPKYQFHRSPKTSMAAGVMHFVIVGQDTRVGLAYTVATAGSDDNAVTAGLGWAYARYHEEQYAASCFPATPSQAMACSPERTTKTTGSAVFMIGGERRISRRLKLVTENYAFAGGGIVSGGVRFLGEHLSADLGVLAPVGAEFVVVVPVINFVWTFGR